MPLREHTKLPPRGKGKAPAEPSGHAGFGTFGGVFTPCTLTILGVIMFLRFGQVVGNSGVILAVVIVLLSKAITTLTAFSLSAIATNTRVRGGGAYFLISRSLGPEFGGSIGLVFFLAQAVSVAMYVLGFTEAILQAFPDIGMDATTVASLTNLAVFICVYIGAGWTIKLQYGILALLLLSLVSFFVGGIGNFDADRLADNMGAGFPSGDNFFTMFALFFPAATGIMAGANMSGDLRNPGRSIPRGTLGSIAFTGLVYVAIALVLGGVASRETLQTDVLVMGSVAWIPLLITLGVFAATLSSALGSMMGSPRILQALGRDDVFSRLSFFGYGDGPNNEPRRAIVLTFLIAEISILLGDLNAIAPVITMFFMITYGYLNGATFYEAVTRNPSYRPRFKYSHWSTAFLGAVGCIVVMFLTSPIAALASIVIMGGIHWYLKRRNVIATWGDAHSGAAFERARKALLKLERDAYHPKNWRPSIIALSGAWNRPHVAIFGYWLTASRGVLALAQVIRGEVGDHLTRRRNLESALRRFIQEQELLAFPAVLVAPTRELGIEALVQCHGLGALRPNVVLLGWPLIPERRVDFARLVRTTTALNRSVVLMREKETDADPWNPPPGTIDVWWRGKDNGHLMVLLAHMLVLNDAWRGREVRLLRVVGADAGVEESTNHLHQLLADARVHATPKVIVADDPVEAIHEHSKDAATVLLGFRPPEEGREEGFVKGVERLMRDLPTTILVWSTGEVRLEA